MQGRGSASSLWSRPSILLTAFPPGPSNRLTNARTGIELSHVDRSTMSEPTTAVDAWEALFRAQVSVMRQLGAEFPDE